MRMQLTYLRASESPKAVRSAQGLVALSVPVPTDAAQAEALCTGPVRCCARLKHWASSKRAAVPAKPYCPM